MLRRRTNNTEYRKKHFQANQGQFRVELLQILHVRTRKEKYQNCSHNFHLAVPPGIPRK